MCLSRTRGVSSAAFTVNVLVWELSCHVGVFLLDSADSAIGGSGSRCNSTYSSVSPGEHSAAAACFQGTGLREICFSCAHVIPAASTSA